MWLLEELLLSQANLLRSISQQDAVAVVHKAHADRGAVLFHFFDYASFPARRRLITRQTRLVLERPTQRRRNAHRHGDPLFKFPQTLQALFDVDEEFVGRYGKANPNGQRFRALNTKTTLSVEVGVDRRWLGR